MGSGVSVIGGAGVCGERRGVAAGERSSVANLYGPTAVDGGRIEAGVKW